MGACASKPKELNGQCPEELPVVASPAREVTLVAEHTPQEAMVEENKEEPLPVGLTEAKPEGEGLAPEISELKLEVPEERKKEDEADSIPAADGMAESEAAEKVEEPAAEEKKESEKRAESSAKKEQLEFAA